MITCVPEDLANKPPVSPYRAYFLVGPTAAGKTAVAQVLAEHRNAVILSADSMLVYRGMDIGTAKPTPSERGGVRYWGIDVVDSFDCFTTALFVEEAQRCFEWAVAEGREVIVVGGTGLYVRALLDGLAPLPQGTAESRAKWQALFERQGVEGLQAALKELNPDWLASLADAGNSRRLIRALELCDAGCMTPPVSWSQSAATHCVTGLDWARPDLVRRIESRVREMYSRGLREEVEGLIKAGGLSATAAQAIGYAETLAWIRGESSPREAMDLTVVRTRQLAKRQMTWFRHQLSVSWIPVTAANRVDEIADRVSEDWARLGPQAIRLSH